MAPHVNRLEVRGKNLFFKTETQHENTRAKMITTNLIETGSLEQVTTSFQEKTLLKRSYPELIPLKKLQKAHLLVKKSVFISGLTKSSIGKSKS